MPQYVNSVITVIIYYGIFLNRYYMLESCVYIRSMSVNVAGAVVTSVGENGAIWPLGLYLLSPCLTHAVWQTRGSIFG